MPPKYYTEPPFKQKWLIYNREYIFKWMSKKLITRLVTNFGGGVGENFTNPWNVEVWYISDCHSWGAIQNIGMFPENSHLPGTSECDFIWKQGLCWCNQVKMRSYCIRRPCSKMGILIRRGISGHRDTGKKPCEDRYQKAWIEVMQLQAKECWQLPEAG